MHRIERLRDNLCEELEKVAKKDEISTSDLEIIDKLAHSIKNIDKIMGQGENSYEQSRGSYGQSNRSYGQSNGSYGQSNGSYEQSNGSYGRGSYNSYEGSYGDNSYARRGRDGDSDGRYNEGRSRDRSYDSYGRGNSREYSRDRMTEKLRRMMDETSNDRERDAIMRCISQLES